MAKARVPLFGATLKSVAIDPEATKGAILGVNLYRKDGRTLLTEDDLGMGVVQPLSKVTVTLWKLIQQIPANITSAAAVATAGFVRRAIDGTWSASQLLASEAGYDNAASGLIGDNVQEALDELAAGEVGGIGAQIGYADSISTTTATTTSSIPLDNTIPQNSEGAAYASLDTTITPKSALSLLEVEIDIPLVSASTAANLAFALFRDSGANAIAATFLAIESVDRGRQLRLRALVTAGSTAATTFKLRWGSSTGTGALLRTNGTAAFLGGVIAATMSVREIKQ